MICALFLCVKPKKPLNKIRAWHKVVRRTCQNAIAGGAELLSGSDDNKSKADIEGVIDGVLDLAMEIRRSNETGAWQDTQG